MVCRFISSVAHRFAATYVCIKPVEISPSSARTQDRKILLGYRVTYHLLRQPGGVQEALSRRLILAETSDSPLGWCMAYLATFEKTLVCRLVGVSLRSGYEVGKKWMACPYPTGSVPYREPRYFDSLSANATLIWGKFRMELGDGVVRARDTQTFLVAPGAEAEVFG